MHKAGHVIGVCGQQAVLLQKKLQLGYALPSAADMLAFKAFCPSGGRAFGYRKYAHTKIK